MTDHAKINLTSSEIAYLWKLYMFETLNRCILHYFLATVEDTDIQMLIQTKLEAKEKRIQKIISFYKQEGIPTPLGYTDRDVNIKAPRLFTDVLMAQYIYFMAKAGIEQYELGMFSSPRSDIRQYFYESLTYFAEIQNKIMDVLLEKGIFTRAPYIPYPQQVDFVKEQSYLTGWFGERRPLHAIQITHLFLNMKSNAVGKELLIGFSQTVKSEDIRKYMLHGKNITSKLMEEFSSILKDDEISVPTFEGLGVTESKEAPFSDKLMLSLIIFLNSYAVSVYGLSLAESTRRDLFAHYTKIIAEIGIYAEDGINLMIKYGYMEEPPKAPDREELASRKE
ncbi:DUF3231 family protein [Neobacillus sp. PS3-12]|uniref:DUF3231 family protein n=1 Tax=Neobacillus sp. PS3-12 TaxID=3070677 RepID=UPI0027E1012B|nr:DUF3231 family protein [Neobacillus sp. PS3-12]WML52234.1 DUF3231 family protein [Neobacillus sp. PS3-12]